MPLVVPGINSSLGSDLTAEWQQKLLGKKIGDSSDTTTFAKNDLPKEHRVLEHGSMATMDHKPDRMNIHLGSDGTVSKVTHG